AKAHNGTRREAGMTAARSSTRVECRSSRVVADMTLKMERRSVRSERVGATKVRRKAKKAGIHSPSIGYNFFPCTLLEGEDLVKEEIDKLIDSTEPNDTKEEMNEPDSSSTIVDIEVEVNHETPEPPRPKRLRCKFYVDDGQ
ncbi:hypothetical protein FOZ62_000306, partial [Perkinsus olseni]